MFHKGESKVWIHLLNLDAERKMKLDRHLKLLVQVEFGSQSLCIK